MLRARSVAELKDTIHGWKRQNLRVGFVPTMGALHEGHLSLVHIARQHADKVVASIFVNPAQFAPHEDLATYPRTEEADCTMLEAAGADLVFLPDVKTIYPEGHATDFIVGGAAEGLESVARPHFFAGVVKVVAKLFNLVQPDVAVFGEKDYQQLCVIRQMVRDLDFPIEIIGGPIIRDDHGLALSSRNAYLSAAELKIARTLNKILFEAAEKISASLRAQRSNPESGSPRRPDSLLAMTEEAKKQILTHDFNAVDYLEMRWGRLLAAVRLGKTRLIDNVPV